MNTCIDVYNVNISKWQTFDKNKLIINTFRANEYSMLKESSGIFAEPTAIIYTLMLRMYHWESRMERTAPVGVI